MNRARASFLAYLAPMSLLLALPGASCGSQPVTASPPQSNPLQFVAEWGMNGEGPGELAEPIAIAVDVNSRVYVADRRTGLLQKFESNGVPLLSYEDSAIRAASALTIDSGDGIYVANPGQGRVWIRFPEGGLLRNFRIAPQRTPDPSFAFCVTADGTIVVPDADGGRIQTYAPSGKLQAVWKLPPLPGGQAARPLAVATGAEDFVYVADAAGRILKYANSGAQVAIWEPPASSAAPLRGIGVSRNYVFVLRGAKPHLEVWTLDGQLKLIDSLAGRLDAPLPSDVALAVTRDDQVFLLDEAQARVLRFRLRL
jgi:hypothetical protein